VSKKKQYKNQLPAALPPKPRPGPAQEPAAPLLPTQASEPELEQVREAIRQLVNDLDGELDTTPRPARPATVPAAAPAPSTERDRASVLKVVGLVLLVLVSAGLGGGAVAWLLGGAEPAQVGDPAPVTLPPGWPEAGASRTLTKVRADGVLLVTHWIHTEKPLDQLDVSLPESGEGTAVEATNVEVTADGEAASGPSEITFSRASYVFDPATMIRVTYELDGAVERSSSAAGRGLATTTALDVSATQPRDVRVIRSAQVLSLSCAATAATELAPCGTSEGAGEWKVQLTGTDAGSRVVAAVTVRS
jgi:hypothetical protein